jgi:hypothetical protein
MDELAQQSENGVSPTVSKENTKTHTGSHRIVVQI